MIIGFDAKRLFNNFTGLGNYSRFVVDALSKNYPDNSYYLFTPKSRLHSDTDAYFSNSKMQIVQPQGWQQKLKAQRYWRSFGMATQVQQHGVQVYHGLSNELPRNLPVGVKKVVSIHDLIFMRFPQYYNKLDAFIYKKKVIHACKIADKIVAISKQTADDLINYLDINPEKIKVVYQGCHANFKITPNQIEQNRVRQTYQLPDNFILSVGTIEQRKNAALIVHALNKIDKDVHLILVGKKTSYAEYINSVALQTGVSNRLHFREQITFADLPYVYQQAKVFVYPSLFEGFGIPIIEAISSGVPVITSKGSCFSEAGGSAAIYVDPHDADSLAENINLVLHNPEKTEEMKNKGRSYIEQFSPEQISKNLMELYSSVLTG
jgi:glycosyltransferase involved in cell wall biosynthesis